MKEKSVAEKVAQGNEKLLLVENEGAILRLAKTILNRLGYMVLASDTPVDALSIAERNEYPIHLRITDVVAVSQTYVPCFAAQVEEVAPC